MTFRVPARTLGIPLSAIAAMLAATGHASSYSERGATGKQASEAGWHAMRGEVIKATEILDGDVTNGFNPLGDVRDLVLARDNRSVDFVLYEAPYRYAIYGDDQDGFVRFDNAAFEDQVYGDLEVRIDDEAKAMGKERLRLTRGQADDRLVSNILGEELTFSQGSTRDVENLLIDGDDGEITHVVVAMNEDSLFNDRPRAIPMEQVVINERGEISASMTLAKVDSMQRYAPEFLK